MKRIDPVLVVLWGGTAMMVIALVIGVIAHRWSEPVHCTHHFYEGVRNHSIKGCDILHNFFYEAGQPTVYMEFDEDGAVTDRAEYAPVSETTLIYLPDGCIASLFADMWPQ